MCKLKGKVVVALETTDLIISTDSAAVGAPSGERPTCNPSKNNNGIMIHIIGTRPNLGQVVANTRSIKTRDKIRFQKEDDSTEPKQNVRH
ncbi:hypothetical protein AVEN_157620-1 [Araneus ventricosus]|uniref:Uncharacterized protein n=1 Tax=Araneus ventricosus TaxID=182803 RepID=A0A4Y2SLF3_ARAVE|nr:hypothetical protein AVEN_66298-1 [Araneus ventricosus]GBN89086.1 hypothetical protein AVEN_157620-1 [Araneus ventricosus]